MKSCFKCGGRKPLSDFYRHPNMPDGHVNKCKECNKKDVRENRRKRIDYYREYDRRRAMRPDRVEARKLYQNSDQGKAVLREIRSRYIEKNPIKYSAHIMVGNAVRDGRLLKPEECESCGVSRKRLHGHHDDYAKPLEVRWLCAKCHKDWHKEHGEAKNAS